MNTPPVDRAIRILLADDHPVVRQGLAAVISRQPGMAVVGEASNGHEAIALFRRYLPAVTLMDLRMPDMDGVEALVAIRTEFPDSRIIVLTTFDTDEDVYRGLRAGAMAYLLKDAPTEELIEAIRAVHAGQKRIPQQIAARLTSRLNNPELTARELEVLRLVVQGKSNRQIAVSLFIGEGTVRAHMNNILSKMGAQDRTQAAMLAIRRGLVRLE
ncbi:response regulator [Gloeobacter kilaueensis]|uniref:Two component LuxR family transcriptional regulator n=1 Tax=Gloeobacter kilaueensis (strain ATCC BAA-2537 / CCAP 1431/1 / ULC 316 / JS1) TaxID=1183438 RepID=U5QNX4_GLOK1|nr:response regulator transcription factor [Gloeobacter kilaueensis]AGY60702.1 two component LuxR family transcriptional regulator [Gloeobacter kilaueensis JS1]